MENMKTLALQMFWLAWVHPAPQIIDPSAVIVWSQAWGPGH